MLTSPRGVFEEGHVDGGGGQMDVSDHAAPDEDVLDRGLARKGGGAEGPGR